MNRSLHHRLHPCHCINILTIPPPLSAAARSRRVLFHHASEENTLFADTRPERRDVSVGPSFCSISLVGWGSVSLVLRLTLFRLRCLQPASSARRSVSPSLELTFFSFPRTDHLISLILSPRSGLTRVSGPAQAITIESEPREDGSRRTTRYGSLHRDLRFSFS